MKLTIITVNYKGWKPLERCLNSLKTLDQKDFTWEVIVVDNFSDDGELVNFKRIYSDFTFIENKGNFGFANGNNLGAKHAKGDYLLFLNSDTVVKKEALSALLNLAYQHNQMAIVSAQQTDLTGKNEDPFDVFPSLWTINSIVKFLYFKFSTKSRNYNCNLNQFIYPDWVSGSLIMIKKKYFDQIGGWDEDFWLYCEDIDLCKRVHEMAGVIVLQCRPSITHQHGGSTRRSNRLSAFFKSMVIISKHIYFKKHFRGWHLFFLQFFLIVNTLLFSNLIPALLGLVFYFIGPARKYLFMYIYLLGYYFNVIRRNSWFIDTKNVIPPEKKS